MVAEGRNLGDLILDYRSWLFGRKMLPLLRGLWLKIVSLASMHSLGSVTSLHKSGWILLYSEVAPVEKR